MIKPEHLIKLLGKSIADPEIERLKEELEDCEVHESHHIIYSFYEHGLEMHFDERILSTMMIYSEAAVDAEDYKAYPYALPHSLNFSLSKAKARKALGKPSRSGADTDIYQFPDHVLYVEFRTDSKTINSLTLMTPEKYAE
jgi:hypothetical protein